MTKFEKELLQYDPSSYTLVQGVHRSRRKNKGITFMWNVANCHKKFKRTQNLVMHLRVHFGVKNFICPYCPKRFTQKGNVQKHVKQHIKPLLNERKSVKCLFCGNMFTEKYNLLVSPILSPLKKQILVFHLLW